MSMEISILYNLYSMDSQMIDVELMKAEGWFLKV